MTDPRSACRRNLRPPAFARPRFPRSQPSSNSRQWRQLTEAIDTTTPGGRLVFHIFGSLSEFEREIVRERTLAGLDSARARGRTGGRPAKLGAKEVEAAMAMLSGSGLTFAEVAAQLGVGRSTLYRHLHASGWEREEASKAVMRRALEDDMEAREDVYRRLAASWRLPEALRWLLTR